MRATLSRRQFVFLAASPAFAAPQAEFSSDVKVVSLLVTVRDKNGMFVNDLSQADFTVTDDNQPQTIAYFSRQYDLPLTLGLLVDTSGSQVEVLKEEVEASATFIAQVLRPDMDQAFLSSFDRRPYLLQNITGVPAQMKASLGILNDRASSRETVNATVLYDAVAIAAKDIMSKQQGRKALVLLTDGEDTASNISLDSAVEACQRADTVIYSIGIGPDLGRGEAALEALSRRTGGSFFEASKKRTIEAIYRTMEEELRSQYNIGYVPPPPTGKGDAKTGKGNVKTGNGNVKKGSAFHKVKLTVNRPGLTARTREGYYSGGDYK